MLDDIYDVLMKNTKYKTRDFTKYKNSYIDYEKKYIRLGDKKLILEDYKKI